MAAVAPINRYKLPMPRAGVPAAILAMSDASSVTPPLAACAARRAAAINSDLPPRSGMTASLSPPPAAPADSLAERRSADAIGLWRKLRQVPSLGHHWVTGSDRPRGPKVLACWNPARGLQPSRIAPARSAARSVPELPA